MNASSQPNFKIRTPVKMINEREERLGPSDAKPNSIVPKCFVSSTRVVIFHDKKIYLQSKYTNIEMKLLM